MNPHHNRRHAKPREGARFVSEDRAAARVRNVVVAWPKRTMRTLSNGLQVVLAESHTFPKIGAQLFFRSGNAVVAHRSPGLADMTATVVRTGTDIAAQPVARSKKTCAAWAPIWDRTPGADNERHFHFQGLAESSPAGLLELVADLARNASFPDDEFERERRQRFEELRIERTTPGFLATERLRRVPVSVISILTPSSLPRRNRLRITSAKTCWSFTGSTTFRRTRCS